MMKKIFKAAQQPGFWSLTDSEIHTRILRYGIVVTEKIALDAISSAKATFFVFPEVPKRTGEYLVDLTISILLEERSLGNNIFSKAEQTLLFNQYSQYYIVSIYHRYMWV